MDIFKNFNRENLFKEDKMWAEFKFKHYSLKNTLKNARTLMNAGGIFGSRYIMARIKEIYLVKLLYLLEI